MSLNPFDSFKEIFREVYPVDGRQKLNCRYFQDPDHNIDDKKKSILYDISSGKSMLNADIRLLI